MAFFIKSKGRYYAFDESNSTVILGEQSNFGYPDYKWIPENKWNDKVMAEAKDLPNAMKGKSSESDANELSKLNKEGKNLVGHAYTEAKVAQEIGKGADRNINRFGEQNKSQLFKSFKDSGILNKESY